jgi:hypothetical protein
LSSSALTATTIFREYYYDNSRKDPLTYKLIQRKPAIVPALSVLFICADVEAKNKVTISEETHLNICLNRNNRIGRNKFSDILGTFEIILIICII